MRYYIHDLDENLQEFQPGAQEAMLQAGLLSVIEDCGLDLPVEKIRDLMDEGHRRERDFTALLVRDHGADWQALHSGFHRRLDRNIIKPYPQISQCFADLGNAQHCLLTHACLEWGQDSIRISKLTPWIPDEKIVHMALYRDEPKHKGPKGFEIALERLGNPDPRDVAFSDDFLPNLETAKAMGMRTVWTSHGRPLPQEAHAYVDHIAGDLCIFLQQEAALLRKELKAASPKCQKWGLSS